MSDFCLKTTAIKLA